MFSFEWCLGYMDPSDLARNDGRSDKAMFAHILCSALAFSPSGVSSRRELLAQFVAGAAAVAPLAANAVSARTGAASVFTGEYDDPNHPGCLRSIKVVGPKVGVDGRKGRNPVAYVKGVDETTPGTKRCDATPTLEQVWKLEGKVSEQAQLDGKESDEVPTILIDFAPKTEGRVGALLGKYDTFGGAPGIVFPDGNKWTKVANGTPSRRPPLTQLNSGD